MREANPRGFLLVESLSGPVLTTELLRAGPERLARGPWNPKELDGGLCMGCQHQAPSSPISGPSPPVLLVCACRVCP